MNTELKTEKDYREFARIGRRLGVPVFEAFLALEVFDKDGNSIKKHKQRSHSWTRNAYNLMFSELAGKDIDDNTFAAGKLSLKETDATVRYGNWPACVTEAFGANLLSSVDAAHADYGYMSPAGNDDKGILVGSGTDAESFEDYVLQTKIVDGAGGGELSHAASEAHVITYTAGTKTLKNDLKRYFNNNSGGTISVNEVALVWSWQTGGVASTRYNLIARDKLGSTVSVADTGQLLVTYTISLVYAG